MPTIAELLETHEAELSTEQANRDLATRHIRTILDRAKEEGREALTVDQDAQVRSLHDMKQIAEKKIREVELKLAEIRKARDEEDHIQALLATPAPAGRADVATPHTPAYDQVARIGREGSNMTSNGEPRWVRRADGRLAVVARDQRFVDHPVVSEYAAARAKADEHIVGHHGTLGAYLRAQQPGQVDSFGQVQQRVVSTTTGSALVPAVWLGDIIDRARAASVVMKAGAELVPMETKVVNIGRLTGDPTATFRAEGSTISASDPTFDNVTLTATTLSALVIGTFEWFQDAPNVDEVVSEAIAQAMASELDLNALMGGVIAGGEVGATGYNRTFATPPAPRGILATLLAVAASSVLGSGANGTAQTAASFWREVQTTLFTPQSFNETPNALLWNSKLNQQYIDAYDTTNQPLRMPENIAALPKFTTNQIESFTQGTMTNVATDLFVGDFTKLLIGQRLDFTVQTLIERYAELGQIGILATWRGDVQLARPRAFAVYRYLQGAV